MDGIFSADAPQSAAAAAAAAREAGAAAAAAGQRRLNALVMSRLPGKQTYGMAEGEIKRKKFDLTLTSAEAFKVLAPQLVTAERRVGFMTLEQVGVVPHAHATTAMLDPGFKQAVFLTDEEDLEEALHEYVTDSTGGVLFRVVVQEPKWTAAAPSRTTSTPRGWGEGRP
jgi:hypothetical protein